MRTVQGEPLPSNPAAVKEDWQYLTENSTFVTEEELLEDKISESAIQSSSNSFTHRFKKNTIKKNISTPSVPSLETDIPPRKRRLRSRLIRRRRKPKGYYARFESDIMGITFLEIECAKDLPPEKNITRTGFDMDPFVIVSYGSSTFRTRAIRHNLNPVWNEKLYFHVKNTQENYKIKFAVYDKDKFTNNDFVASQEISISEIIQNTTSSLGPTEDWDQNESPSETIEHQMGRLTFPLNLAKADKWKNSPTLTIRAKFVPYLDIRKMFWVTLAKTCDANNSNTLGRLEVQSMLETLGSNISETTLDKFWERHNKDFADELTLDELAESLEWFMRMSDDERTEENPTSNNAFFLLGDEEEEEYEMDDILDNDDGPVGEEEEEEEDSEYSTNNEDDDDSSSVPSPDEADYEALAEGDGIQYIDGPLKSLELNKEQVSTHHKVHEKVIRLNECPICHRPNLSKRGQMDIVTHVATCAANDWTTVDRFLMGNFGSEAQAQRK